jgi:hypothetical protein
MQNKITAPITTNSAAGAEADAVAEWVASPEGQKALRDALDKAGQAIAKLEEASRVTLESLRKPVTV